MSYGPNVRIISPKRHMSRAWEYTPYWQTALMKRASSDDDGLTDDDYAKMPDSLKMPTTRAGLNAMMWESRKTRAYGRRHTKTVHHDKFMRRLGLAAVSHDDC